MSQFVRTIRLYGELGTKFGRVHRLAVRSASEAVRALSVLLPGFEAHMMRSKDRGVTYSVFLGKRNIDGDQLQDPAGTDDIRIAPILVGSKRGGLFQTILGIALIAGAVIFSGGTLLGATSVFTAGGMTQAVAMAGASLALGGVAQMMTPIPKGIGAKDSAENSASYNFNGAVNTQAQGNIVPLLYGRMIVGSAVISAGIHAVDAYVPYGSDGRSSDRGNDVSGGGGSSPWHLEWVE